MGIKVQQRHVLTAMLFIATTIAFAERGVLPMAITRMVAIPQQNDVPTNEAICTAPKWAANATDGPVIFDEAQHGAKYDWTQKQQGIILSAFYVGYIASHIPGGLLAQAYGGKHVLGLGITISALLSMVIPIAVQFGDFYALIVVRALMGIFQGPMHPALVQLMSAWIPVTERAFLTAIVFSGINAGPVIASYFSGIIMYYFGWEAAFYVFGLLAVVWYIILSITCYDDPASHPYISVDEQNYLLKELGQLERHEDQSVTPWREVLTSKPVWALIIAKTCGDWTYFIASTTLPKYMNDVLHMSIRDIGAFTSMPWILKTITSYAFGYAIDKSIGRQRIGLSNARKLAVILASVFPAIFIILASYAECQHTVVIVCFMIAIGTLGFLTCGLNLNPMDLSPNYAATLMSFANSAAAISGVIAPYTVGLLTTNAYLSEWRLVFWITFGVSILTSCVFTTWGSGEVQPWNSSRNRAAIVTKSRIRKP